MKLLNGNCTLALSDIAKKLKGSGTSGNFGHGGRPGKIGGSTVVTVAGGLSTAVVDPTGTLTQIPGGQYNSVYSVATNRKQAINKAGQLGSGHVVVRLNNAYHVINTTPTTTPAGTHPPQNKVVYQTDSKQYATKKAKMLGPDHQVVNVNGKYQVVQVSNTLTAPAAKQYSSKVEELYDKATPSQKALALKTGLLATDPTAEAYIKEHETKFLDPSAKPKGTKGKQVISPEREKYIADVDAHGAEVAKNTLFKEIGVTRGGHFALNPGQNPAINDITYQNKLAAEKLLASGKITQRTWDPYATNSSGNKGMYVEKDHTFDSSKYKIVEVPMTQWRGSRQVVAKLPEYTIVPKTYTLPPTPKLEKPPKKPKADIGNPQFAKMSALSTVTGVDQQKIISSYSQSWDKKNHQFKGRIENVFKITPPKPMQDKFDEIAAKKDNIKTGLYHGTGVDVAPLIASGGYIVTKNAKAGRMLGDGLYLANTSSKSMQYIGTSFSRTGGTRGVLFANKVSLGNMGDTSKVASGSGYGGSTAGNNILANHDSLYAPKNIRTNVHQQLINDEYVVKDPAAVLPDYWLDVVRT